jgi:hypothetical protein
VIGGRKIKVKAEAALRLAGPDFLLPSNQGGRYFATRLNQTKVRM